MSTRTDYDQMTQTLDYAKLERKLDQLREKTPPKKRKTIADMLAPVRDRLLELHANGWTYEKLAQELAETGASVKVATLRNYLSSRGHGGKKSTRRRASKSAHGGGADSV